ncbi:FAD-dependent oxidoreductase [Pseudodesulfovibrio sp. zrk46]|uniref:FAD-dependent oxidoreductase n=1 Tax=Pseudodesulfovibrio sp. zrk46 TaxID=2725288 RepID=UPI0014491B39|nr:FAD-dependent oxidoreductase [Pseudodesulfovibrio sp. zrk46]QJB56807.1 FAD-dependent oxidoreductase [Pseudodesulfovibrio sp. zrk46]
MSEQIILIGADEPGLNGVIKYLRSNPDTKATVLYPEINPLPEFTCMTMERYLGRGIEFPETLRAIGVDRENKRVNVRDDITGAESFMAYDKLVFASSSTPADLEVPGDHYSKIIRLGSMADAVRLIPAKGKHLVVGSGLNLLLAASVLLGQGNCEIEMIIQKDGTNTTPLSDNLFRMVKHHLTESGVKLHEDTHLTKIEAKNDSLIAITDNGEFEADRIVNATPNMAVSYLAAEAGLETDDVNGIIVDALLRTQDPNIFACGKCASFLGEMCKSPVPGVQVASTTVRQANILAAMLEGSEATQLTPVSAYSIPLTDITVAGAGLSVEAARHCGFTPMSSTVIQFDRAHFMPDAELMTLELVFDAPTRRVLGIQGLSRMGEALCGRISAVAALLPQQPTIDDISNLEVAYSPPFASAMDVLNTVANVADNILMGTNEGISTEEFEKQWAERETGNDFFLDCRELGNAEPYLNRHPVFWNHIPQGELARRLDEVPRDKRIILLCNTGTRSYEAQVVLKHAGYEDVVNVDGGMAAVKQSGVEV